MPYKITITDECIGCGSCEAIAPELYTIKDGKAKAKKAKIDDKQLGKAKEAADACPVNAIKISKA